MIPEERREQAIKCVADTLLIEQGLFEELGDKNISMPASEARQFKMALATKIVDDLIEDGALTWRQREPGKSTLASEPPATPQQVMNLLSLVPVVREAPKVKRAIKDKTFVGFALGEVSQWSQETLNAVRDWAVAVYLRASDNDDVVIPPTPEVLK